MVLANVRAQLAMTSRRLVADRSYGDVSLARYLDEAGRDLADVYGSNGSWTALRREAGLTAPPAGPDEETLLRRVAAFAHVDDRERAEAYSQLADPSGPTYHDLSARKQRLARMLFFGLWLNLGGFSSYDDELAHLRRHPAVCTEIPELVAFSLDRGRHMPSSVGLGLQHVPLASHARYRREELLSALGWTSLERAARGAVIGVAWAEETQTDALMVNLHKSEKEFSPTTMYRAYAISAELFQWESQNTTSTDSPAGRRNLRHRELGTHMVPFVRDAPRDEIGAAPFLCLGQASYVEHRGKRPIAITWRLHRPMPADTCATASVVAH